MGRRRCRDDRKRDLQRTGDESRGSSHLIGGFAFVDVVYRALQAGRRFWFYLQDAVSERYFSVFQRSEERSCRERV